MGNNFTPILLALALLLLPVQWESVSGSGLLCKEEERRALLHIKAELSCSFLEWEGKECCHWERVTCHSRTGHVIELDLRYPDGPHMINAYSLLLNATIFLPLRQLRSLSLSELGICDCVAGAGFESWSTLNKLKMLDLSYNELNRSIISSLAQVPSLRIIDLEGNVNMTGNVPVNEFSATNLEVLNLRDCGFNGSLPYLGDWSSLKAFSVSGNDLYGTITSTGLCRLKNLEELDLSYNNFAGTLPPCLGNLSSLKLVDLSHNQFQIEFPTSFFERVISLRYLSLSNNQLEGTLSLILVHFRIIHILKLWHFQQVHRTFESKVPICHFNFRFLN
ncbi:receptor like protein 9 [Rhynchospora pubera]|uniref:Receptor like protein 9 n=1 Tax=Rhynchospora pubera TaxID=906938 RepID=A0AAV8GRK7_9POAL|nr:receptor like protein 9 [Rhynchospora pubera]